MVSLNMQLANFRCEKMLLDGITQLVGTVAYCVLTVANKLVYVTILKQISYSCG